MSPRGAPAAHALLDTPICLHGAAMCNNEDIKVQFLWWVHRDTQWPRPLCTGCHDIVWPVNETVTHLTRPRHTHHLVWLSLTSHHRITRPAVQYVFFASYKRKRSGPGGYRQWTCPGDAWDADALSPASVTVTGRLTFTHIYNNHVPNLLHEINCHECKSILLGLVKPAAMHLPLDPAPNSHYYTINSYWIRLW